MATHVLIARWCDEHHCPYNYHNMKGGTPPHGQSSERQASQEKEVVASWPRRVQKVG